MKLLWLLTFLIILQVISADKVPDIQAIRLPGMASSTASVWSRVASKIQKDMANEQDVARIMEDIRKSIIQELADRNSVNLDDKQNYVPSFLNLFYHGKARPVIPSYRVV